MKYGRRFWISWIVSSLTMFGLSYVWHGIVLNDFTLLSYPVGIYITAAAVAYLFIGLIVGRAFMFEFLHEKIEHPLVRGPLVGLVSGIVVYMVSMVVGITFSKHVDLSQVLLDAGWQMFEQMIGGFAVGLVSVFVFDPSFVPEEDPTDRPTLL